ncbi:Galactose oxidase/kelch, beta-propeller domain and WD40/YVTN repeat-like-containing domain-containing protein [Strongyloides ratti]|uniref:Galactose oxidase/kelch, beta-propeller domain and WD40/YVTN repeat-like-containing domain-containing protein n=1 Tax=Strongyloides ratti TaxID=34506 RepID=A0A090MMM6_STRRB|nr:Galactose oxidase/kelch, beta-propeller domain and WD40/YVTN repeat-like-containing domain-containing protein [Strongyloides ratti]CEF59261.1 Galactose oxidase/kelch, beta-propeller domain and WD40/YVTN repeat-like-containing domain-containing protein [Strongyloides ratti]
MDSYETKICDFKKWDNPKARFDYIVLEKYIYFFETKHFEQPSINWGHFITHRGGNFSIFDSEKNVFIETGKDKIEAINEDELTEEIIFTCGENLYMLLYNKSKAVSFNKLYKWDMSKYSWEFIFSLTGDTNLKSKNNHGIANVIIANSCQGNKAYSVVSYNGDIILLSIDVSNGNVENLFTLSSEENESRSIITQAIYHNGIVDCFGGCHGCGFMHFYNKMYRLNIDNKEGKFIELGNGGFFGINVGLLTFAHYLKDKDCIIVKRGWTNGAGMGRVTYDGSIWVLENLQSEKPRWRKLFNTVSQIGEQGVQYFADVITSNNMLYHGSLESGIFVQTLNFDDASKIVKKLTGPFGDTLNDVAVYHMNNKLYILGKELIYNSNMTMPQSIIRKNKKIYIFDLLQNKLETTNEHEIKGIDCDDELFESVFVSQNELYIALFNPYDHISFEELYKLDTNNFQWVSVFKKENSTKGSYDINKICKMIEIDGISYGNKFYVIYSGNTYSLYELDISKNEFYEICSKQFDDVYCGKPISGVAFGDFVYVLYGHEGCGFMWNKSNLISFDLVKRDAKIIEITTNEDEPQFSFSGASVHQLAPHKGYWLQMTGQIRQGMSDSIYSGDIYAIDFTTENGPCWKKIDVNIPNNSNNVLFIFFDNYKNRLVYGNPGTGIFEQTVIINLDDE